MRAKTWAIVVFVGGSMCASAAMAGPTTVKATSGARARVAPSVMPMGPDGPGINDNFNGYSVGPLSPQGGWLLWDGGVAAQNGTVVFPCYPDCTGDGALSVADFGCFQGKYVLGDLYADCTASGGLTVADFGCFQGKYVLGCTDKYVQAVVETDLVQVFNITPATNPSGKWQLKVDTYVASTQLGDGFLIVLDTFAHPYVGGGHWSIQVHFNTTTITSDFGAQTTPSLVDQWVQLVCDINLVADTLNITYGGTQFVTGAVYSTNVSGPVAATMNIQCIDLYSQAAGFRWDNLSLLPVP